MIKRLFFSSLGILLISLACFAKDLDQIVKKQSFETLLGKDSIAWKHLSQSKDQQELSRYKKLYEKNKHLQFVEQKVYKIPKIIHFIWIGPRNFPIESIKNVRTWLANHPDWTFYFWTDRDRPSPCNGMEKKLLSEFRFEKLFHIFDAAKNWSQKADILTYEILKQYGGIYVDHDANSLLSFDRLNKAYDFYACLELPQKRISGFSLAAGHGLIGTKPNHPVIAKAIDVIEQRWKEVNERYPQHSQDHKTKQIMNSSYIALTFALQEGLEKDGNIDIIFPASYFFAQYHLASLYSKHFFANSWLETKQVKDDHNVIRDTLGALIKKMNKIVFFQQVFIGIFLLSTFLFLWRWKKRFSYE